MAVAVFLVVGLVGTSGSVGAAPPNTGASERNPGQCDTRGNPEINITREVINSLDTGTGDEFAWATSEYRQQVKVYEQEVDEEAPDVFCVVTGYEGEFEAIEGHDSPGARYDDEGNNTLEGDERGRFDGGAHWVFEGELKDDPDARTRGFVGTDDHDCDIDGTCDGDGAFGWVGDYFESLDGVSAQWWGWIYHGGPHGTWVNQCDGPDPDCDGNSGDID